MKSERNTYVRFTTGPSGQPEFGLKVGDEILQLAAAPWSGGNQTDIRYKLSEIKFLAPVQPTKIICVGLNYTEHVGASQLADRAPDQPMLFLKPPSAIIGAEHEIVFPSQAERVDFEAELGVVIGKRARNISPDEALAHIFGVTCVNDVTARDLQKTDGQWGRAKGFDTFCPVGPWIISGIDTSALKIEGILNGTIKQLGNTANMIFNVPYLVSFISSVMTLEPGDLISTGTPAGIEPMRPGDVIEVRIENVGTLRNPVVRT